MIRLLLLSILMSGTCVFCQSYSASSLVSYQDTIKLTGKDSAYLMIDQALDLMKRNYYEKNGIGWDSIVTEAKRKLVSARTCQDSYAILSDCFKAMKAGHSFIMPPINTAIYNNDTSSLHRKLQMKEWVGEIQSGFHDEGIAYLTVPWVGTTNPSICTRIADSLQHIIECLDKTGISKWIVDLRNNRGGNCWPMISGIGPLIAGDTCGYFVMQETLRAIRYKDGNAMNGNRVICSVSQKPYITRIAKKYIAVLVGPGTCSSGEIIALAFKGSPNTVLFGEPTAGLTTANTTYSLLDKSMLVLSVYGEADRFGKLCRGNIVPDELITVKPSFPTDDPVMNAATMWLQIF